MSEPGGGGGGGARWLPEFAHPVQQPERSAPPPRRVRVVLAERKRARRVVRTLAEVEEQTVVGEMLVRRHIRSQLTVSLGLALVVVAFLGLVPAAFYLVDGIASWVPWVVLGVLAHPVLIGIGWIHVRLAERNEQLFVTLVED